MRIICSFFVLAFSFLLFCSASKEERYSTIPSTVMTYEKGSGGELLLIAHNEAKKISGGKIAEEGENIMGSEILSRIQKKLSEKGYKIVKSEEIDTIVMPWNRKDNPPFICLATNRHINPQTINKNWCVIWNNDSRHRGYGGDSRSNQVMGKISEIF